MKLLAAYSIAALLAVTLASDKLQSEEKNEADHPVSILQKLAFPYYAMFATSAQWIYGYFDAEMPINTKVAWWTVFLAGDGLNSAKDIVQACNTCKARHEDPPGGSCTQDTMTAVQSVLLNLVAGYIGWHLTNSNTFNRSLKCQDTENLSIVEKSAIMFHTYVLAGFRRIIGYCNRPLPVWVEPGWWVALVIVDGIIFGRATQMENAYNSCVANHIDLLSGSCQDDLLTVLHGIVRTVTFGIIPKIIILFSKQCHVCHGTLKRNDMCLEIGEKSKSKHETLNTNGTLHNNLKKDENDFRVPGRN
ncbi:hypothetical protein NCAS_0F04100 [Naumovozyma castellii]|uniref:Uncharacterized protein n=1 Tax=Naumovozyma castellii TaxID=27288 RepID=G0VHC1_NAUCA|nr:hypothetical protein NCAS_0F04100 [Naumovozyma castellii CBS 4309]CCC70894.1 hypothetical protein NCAS_0F04100 [Naumovozyma castellii CBS 4309]